MTVPSRSFRNCTRLYCMAGKRIPTVGPSTLLAFRGERTPKNKEFNSILRTPIALEEVNRILLRTTNLIKKFGNLGRNESNVNSPPTLSQNADGCPTQANAGLESATREAESAGECGAGGGSRTLTGLLSPADFLTDHGFRRPDAGGRFRLRFAVWTIPSPSPRCSGA